MESKAHYEAGKGDELTPLASSGVSPWSHRAVVTDGCLTLYWRMSGGGDRVRCFTKEETSALLDILYESRNDIHRVDLGSGKCGVCPVCLETLDATDMCPNKDRQDHIEILRNEFVEKQS